MMDPRVSAMPTLSGPLSLGSDTQLLGNGPLMGTGPLVGMPAVQGTAPLLGTAPLFATTQLPVTELLAESDRLPEADLWRVIWFLSWPLVLSMVLSLSVSLIEAAIAGQFSAQAQAAAGMAMQVIFLLNTPATALSLGAQVMLAHSFGAGEQEAEDALIRRLLRLTIRLSLGTILLVWCLAPWGLSLMGAPEDVTHQAVDYLRLMLPGLLPMNLAMVINAVFRARGDMFLRLLNNGVEALVWIAGGVILGGNAGLGLSGLAIAFITGKSAGLAVAWSQLKGIGLLPRRQPRSPFDPPRVSTTPEKIRRVLRVGFPAALQNVLRPLGCLAVFSMLGGTALPASATAAYTVGSRIETCAFLLVFAFNVAAATLVGQSLGANDPERAERACWRMTHLAVGAMVVVGFGLFWGAELLASCFTMDPLVIDQTGEYLRAMALSEPFLAIATVLSGALQGAGSTRSPLIIAVGTQFAVGLPLGYFLAFSNGMGAAGVWWALSVANIAQGLLVMVWFRQGAWRRKTI